MKTKKITISLLVLSFCMISCSPDKHRLDQETLLNHYNSAKDTLKKEAASFLLENMTDQVSEVPESGFLSVPEIIPDSLIINNQWLMNNINSAFESWNKYPWADSVPKDVFFNYLLPYKIYGERPSDWRKYFFDQYRDSMEKPVQTAPPPPIQIDPINQNKLIRLTKTNCPAWPIQIDPLQNRINQLLFLHDFFCFFCEEKIGYIILSPN